jgi:hypothetical protein
MTEEEFQCPHCGTALQRALPFHRAVQVPNQIADSDSEVIYLERDPRPENGTAFHGQGRCRLILKKQRDAALRRTSELEAILGVVLYQT